MVWRESDRGLVGRAVLVALIETCWLEQLVTSARLSILTASAETG